MQIFGSGVKKKCHLLPVVCQTVKTPRQLHLQKTLEPKRNELLLAEELPPCFQCTDLTWLVDTESHIDMECRLGVKVTALPGEPVLLVNVVTDILQ